MIYYLQLRLQNAKQRMKLLLKRNLIKLNIIFFLVFIYILLCINDQLYYTRTSRLCNKCKREFKRIQRTILKPIDGVKAIKFGQRFERTQKIENFLISIFDKNKINVKTDFNLKLLSGECRYKNCYFTGTYNNKTSYDAVLFKKNELKKYIFDLLAINNYNDKIDKIPIMKNRDENQVWILWNNDRKIDKYYDDFLFNWTISYRLDSEISSCVNGCTRKLKIKSESQFDESNLKNKFDRNIDTKIKAVYFIDDCKLNNINENKGFNFALGLNKIYNITFISSCYLDFKNQIELEFQETFIKNDIKNEYLFALSFDPLPNCNSYLSKKFWYYLKNNLIPIVIYPNKMYYEQNAPLNSYIHVEDFDYDVKKLSEYLKKIETNFNIYIKYFEWHETNEIIVDEISLNENIECEICEKLNEQDSEIYYTSVSKWFQDGCLA